MVTIYWVQIVLNAIILVLHVRQLILHVLLVFHHISEHLLGVNVLVTIRFMMMDLPLPVNPVIIVVLLAPIVLHVLHVVLHFNEHFPALQLIVFVKKGIMMMEVFKLVKAVIRHVISVKDQLQVTVLHVIVYPVESFQVQNVNV